jgi:hypothetical protein
MRTRRTALLAAAATACAGWSSPGTAQRPVQRPLTADDFRNARQRGFGIGLLRFGNRAETDHDALLSLGATHVRVFLDVDRDPGADFYRLDGKQLAALDAMLTSLEARGLYLVLTATFGNGDARTELWRSPRLQAGVVQVWRELALRLRGRIGIAGFDIVNEPVPPGLTYAARQDRWLELAGRIIESIRAVDPQRVVVVESAPDSTGESFASMRPLPFPNLVYSVHSYAPYAFTHQGVAAEHPQSMTYGDGPSGAVAAAAALAESLQPVQAFASRHDVPIYVGEFSVIRWAPGDSAARYVADSVALFNRNGWSWAYHEFRAWHGWDAEIADQGRDARQRSADAPVLRALRAGLRAGRP